MKKHLKLLTLLLALALVIGAMAVVVGAAAEVPETAELYCGDELIDEGGFSDMVDAIMEDEREEDTAYTIKLLGKCSETVDSVNFSEFYDDFARTITVDLNGYSLDMSYVDEPIIVGKDVSLIITGTGEVKSGGVFATVEADASLTIGSSVSGIGFSITDAEGLATYYNAEQNLVTAIGDRTGITVKLYADVTVGTKLSVAGAHKVYIDLNSKKLTVTDKIELSASGTLLAIYSSVPGGKLVDGRASEGPIFQAYNGSQFAIGAYGGYAGSNVTLEVRRMAEVSQYGGVDNYVIDGATIIAQPTQYGIFNSQLNGGKNGVTIKNSTIICVKTGAGLILTHQNSNFTFDNCDFINLAGVTSSVIAGTTNAASVISFNNCRFGAPVGTSNGTVNVSGDCAFITRPSGVNVLDAGKVIGIKEETKMAMPAALGSSYTITYGANATLTAEDMPTLKFGVKDGPADPIAFKVTDGYGVTTDHYAGEDLNAVIKNRITVTLCENYTVTSALTANFENANLKIDLNGKTLSFESTWMNILRASSVYIYSSQPNGKIVDARDSTEGKSLNALFEFYFYGGLLQIGKYNDYSGSNVTVEVKKLANMNAYSAESKIVLDGVTVNNISTNLEKGMISVTNQDGRGANTATFKDTTFINKVENNALLGVNNASVANFEDCNFINTESGCKVISENGGTSAINFNNCYFAAPIGTSNGTVNVSGGCAFAEKPTGVTVAQGYVVAYNVINTGVENMPTLYYVVAAEADTTTYNWNFDGNTVYSVVAVAGADVTALNAQATAACGTKDLNVLRIKSDGNWVQDGNTFTCGTKAAGVVSGTASVNITLHEGFDINFYVTPEVYEYLDADSKELLAAVNRFDADYYGKILASPAANEIFDDAQITVTFVEDGYSYTATYVVDVFAYISSAIKVADDNNKAMAYYIAAYINSAYAYFGTEADEKDLAALASLVEANASLYNADAVARPEVDEPIDTDDVLDISIDLTATPAYVIKSTVAGKVTFNGVEYEIKADDELVLNASVLNFDNALAFELEDGTTGTYCLGNYAARVAAGEIADVVDIESLKTLVEAFYDYVIYAENFRPVENDTEI